MRGILFIGAIAALAYFMFLKKEDVERFDLDQKETVVNEVEKEVQKAVDAAQQQAEALKNNAN